MSETLIRITEENVKVAEAASYGGEIAIIIPALMGRTDKVYTVASVDEFNNIFGSYDDKKWYRECRYLLNRGNVLKVVRTALADGTQAKAKAEFGYSPTPDDFTNGGLRVEAIATGAAYNGLKIKLVNQGSGIFSVVVLKTVGSVDTIVESYPQVSLDPNSIYYFGDTVNSDRVVLTCWVKSDDELIEGYDPTKAIFAAAASIDSAITKALASGTGDTYGETSALYKAAAEYLADMEVQFATLLILGSDSVVTPSFVKTVYDETSLATRKDFELLVNINTADYSTALTAVSAYNNSYAAVCWPNGRNSFLGTVKASIALADLIGTLAKNGLVFRSPAGIEYGVITDWIDTETGLSATQIKNLQNARINPIVIKNSVGSVIWGDWTLALSANEITSLPVRLLVNYLKRTVYSISQKYLFKTNDSLTWNAWVNEVTPVIRGIADVNGIRDYLVKCDESTMSESDISKGILRGKIWIRPASYIHAIEITFTVDETGVTFE